MNVPKAELEELRRRIKATVWPERETVSDASQGVQLATMQALARDIHFIHVKSKHPNALPVIVTHGWPGSIVEQLKIIDPLR